MFVQQLYTNCLAEAAYYIESNGEAAIIDPIREIEPYIALAKSRGSKIKYVFETHFHADFVSGHIDLAKQTGATIIFGPLAETKYKVYNAKDGEEFKVGDIIDARGFSYGGMMSKSFSVLTMSVGMQYERSTMTLDYTFQNEFTPNTMVHLDLEGENRVRGTAGFGLDLGIGAPTRTLLTHIHVRWPWLPRGPEHSRDLPERG